MELVLNRFSLRSVACHRWCSVERLCSSNTGFPDIPSQDHLSTWVPFLRLSGHTRVVTFMTICLPMGHFVEGNFMKKKIEVDVSRTHGLVRRSHDMNRRRRDSCQL